MSYRVNVRGGTTMYNQFKKQFWILILLGVSFPILTNILAWIPSPITKGNSSTWIGFFGGYFGSIVGGILGAIIAFGVAKFQIDQQRIIERERVYVNQLPVLIKIRMELDAFESNLKNIKGVFFNKNTPIPIDLNSPMTLPEINLVENGELARIINPELQANLLNLKYFHNDLVKIIAIDTNKINIEINRISAELERLNNKKTKNQKDQIRIDELIKELMDLTLERESSLSNKKYYFDNINKNLELIEKLKETVNSTYDKAIKLSRKLES
jgi:hypothetical protein